MGGYACYRSGGLTEGNNKTGTLCANSNHLRLTP